MQNVDKTMKIQSCKHNPYVEQMYTEYKDWSFDENASQFKGLWRSGVFQAEDSVPLDLEIGTGNGTHFAQISYSRPERLFLGLELKFKTLVQSIRRCRRRGATNARVARYAAENISEFLAPGEINDVYIHFPDPWPKRRQQKNRLIQKKFLEDLYAVMRPGSHLEFKTDDYPYFKWAMSVFNKSSFEIIYFTEDLHNSFRKDKNFVTHFETLFLARLEPIYYCRLKRY